MKLAWTLFLLAASVSLSATASESSPRDSTFYRDLVLSLPGGVSFRAIAPADRGFPFQYELQFSLPKWEQPLTLDFPVPSGDPKNDGGAFIRYFWDKIFLKPGSTLNIAGEKVPLTCVHVEGRDSRWDGRTDAQRAPLLLKVILVANDPSCTGPLNPDWPANGGKKESWSTTLQYQVTDTQTMLPQNAVLRYHWLEYEAMPAGSIPVAGLQ